MEASASAAPIVAPLPQPTLEASKASYIELRRQKQSMLHPTGSEHTKKCNEHLYKSLFLWADLLVNGIDGVDGRTAI